MLRGLALTADGSKLATASTKGTVLRVWDVATSACLQEFRRGVERANITCLCWSWDYQWLSCTSDKGTAHVFFVGDMNNSNNNNSKNINKNNNKAGKEKKSSSDPTTKSLTKRLFSSVRKSVEGDAKKYSVCQVRGVPHPLACAFVVDAPNVLAVAGWDADGNGVLLLSEFAANQEARRIAYHVLVKSSLLVDTQGQLQPPETEEERRRRRLRGWKPTVPATPIEGRVFCGERGETLEQGMEQIQFEDKGEFVTITTTTTAMHNNNSTSNKEEDNPVEESSLPSKPVINDDKPDQERNVASTDSDNNNIPEETTSKEGSATLQDSVRTEPLDEPEKNETSLHQEHLEAEATLQ
jgi:WD40 repeat protein